MVHHLKVDDFDTWKPFFDQDPVGRKQSAKGHVMLRNADDPNEVFIVLEFASLDEAREAERRLVESGVLDRFADRHGPNVVEET